LAVTVEWIVLLFACAVQEPSQSCSSWYTPKNPDGDAVTPVPALGVIRYWSPVLLIVTGENSASPGPFVPEPETTGGADSVADVGFAERRSETEMPDRGLPAASFTIAWIAAAPGVYATLEMFCGVPFTKAESVGPRLLTNATVQFPESGVGSPGEVKELPVKFPPDFATRPHVVGADVVHGAVAVNITVKVVDELAVIPRPWIWVDDARVTPVCDDESTEAIDHPDGAVRLNELAWPLVVLSVNV
jgi:hypothetical protein